MTGWAASLEEDYKLKQMCAKSAREFAKEHSESIHQVFHSMNHYDKKRNICFAIFEEYFYEGGSSNKMVGSGFSLYDVDEGVLYGSYSQFFSDKDTFTDKGRVPANAPTCFSAFISSPSVLKSVCKEDIFRDHLKAHMRE